MTAKRQSQKALALAEVPQGDNSTGVTLRTREHYELVMGAAGEIDPDLGPPAHRCIEHLVSRSHDWRESHGEPCHQEWDECTVCGDVFDERNPPPSFDPGDPAPMDWNAMVTLRETLERTR